MATSVLGRPFVATQPVPQTISRRFCILAATTVVAIIALVLMGALVRTTGSGLGCPDWPLCHGRLIPPLNIPTLIEYSHRLMASVVGILVFATAVLAKRSYYWERRIVLPATIGLSLLVLQVILGGATVLLELPGLVVLAHLALAEALLASMVVVYVVAQRGQSSAPLQSGGVGQADRFPALAVVTALATYALLLTGAYVTASGSAAACGNWWPLCHGTVLPAGLAPFLHMAHRLVSLPVAMLVLTTLVVAWRRRRRRQDLGRAAVIAAALFLFQLIVGAANVWLRFPLATQLLHVLMATMVWAGLVALAVLARHAPRPHLKGAPYA